MKHLKNFIKESKSTAFSKIDKDYVEMCFINLIDSERFRQIQMYKYDTCMEVSFNLPLPEIKNYANSYFKKITPFINCGVETHQLFLDVEDCVNKVKIEYPDYIIVYKQFTHGFVPNVFVVRITL